MYNLQLQPAQRYSPKTETSHSSATGWTLIMRGHVVNTEESGTSTGQKGYGARSRNVRAKYEMGKIRKISQCFMTLGFSRHEEY